MQKHPVKKTRCVKSKVPQYSVPKDTSSIPDLFDSCCGSSFLMYLEWNPPQLYIPLLWRNFTSILYLYRKSVIHPYEKSLPLKTPCLISITSKHFFFNDRVKIIRSSTVSHIEESTRVGSQ
ncbi:hypothetical protein CDAR_59561 [Caerostris darwini]|uniref:Uncharacterized protein n=1 Tax=Caerostris darwini TaxID=1538125 RepID=A0AAV4X5N3_9ARAC|nr:hypothetical protein CDAR_59561 [Caerostris darwini]